MGRRKVPLPAQGVDPAGSNLSNREYYNKVYDEQDKNAKLVKLYKDTTNGAIDRI